MSQDKGMEAFGRVVNAGHWLGLSPYTYHKNSGEKIHFDESRRLPFKYRISFAFLLVNSCVLFFLCQSVRGMMSERASLLSIIKPAFSAFVYMSANFNCFSSLKVYGENHKCINAVLAIMEGNQSLYRILNLIEFLIFGGYSESGCRQ
jgi:hypothetical protein